VGLIAGRLSRAEAEAKGVSVAGDVRRLRRLRPRPLPAGPAVARGRAGVLGEATDRGLR
jgi:hypothetical protein